MLCNNLCQLVFLRSMWHPPSVPLAGQVLFESLQLFELLCVDQSVQFFMSELNHLWNLCSPSSQFFLACLIPSNVSVCEGIDLRYCCGHVRRIASSVFDSPADFLVYQNLSSKVTSPFYICCFLVHLHPIHACFNVAESIPVRIAQKSLVPPPPPKKKKQTNKHYTILYIGNLNCLEMADLICDIL